jgi:hypothetical protein
MDLMVLMDLPKALVGLMDLMALMVLMVLMALMVPVGQFLYSLLK